MTEEWKWDPDTYLDSMLSEIDGYEELQQQAAEATTGIEAATVLELGSEPARRRAGSWSGTRTRR